jgi:hypothetical protein
LKLGRERQYRGCRPFVRSIQSTFDFFSKVCFLKVFALQNIPFLFCCKYHGKKIPAIVRVTRLVEFLPIGRLFILDSFLKITEVAHIFGYFFVRYSLIWQKWFGNILGDVFTNLSGHPVHR